MRLRAVSATEFRYLPQAATVHFELGDGGEVLGLRFEQGGGGGSAKKLR